MQYIVDIVHSECSTEWLSTVHIECSTTKVWCVIPRNCRVQYIGSAVHSERVSAVLQYMGVQYKVSAVHSE